MERDERISNAEIEFKHRSGISQPQLMAEFQDIKMRIEWDIAWQIFDHVNEHNDTQKEIDLHCLDVFEAESITKQCIYECARGVQNQSSKSIFSMNLFCTSDPRPSFVEKVLAIRYAKEHIVKNENKILTMLRTDFEYLDFY